MAETGKVMAGLTVKSLKKHPALLPLLAAVAIGATGAAFYVARLATRNPDLIPLLAACGAGAALAGGYLLRLATQNPDCSWDRKNNPHPWQKMKPTDQYKFYAAKHDYKTLQHPEERPDI